MSPEISLLVAPWRAWPEVAKAPSRHWLARPLFALFVYGCAASLMASGRVTLRIAAPAMVYAAFAPLLQMAALAAVCRGALPFRNAVDLFFAGHAAVSLPLLALSATALAGSANWRAAAAVMVVWSGYVDYWFFRSMAGRGPGAALATLVLHRLLWGIPAIAIFVGPAAWQEALKAVGL